MQDDGTPMVSYDMQILQHRTVKRQDFTLPEVGEHVLCLFLPNGNQEGFILASFYTGSNLFEYPIGSKRLAGKTGIYRSHYADDSEFEYDLNTHTLRGYTNHADIELGRIEPGRPEGGLLGPAIRGERLLETGKTTVHIKVNGDDGIINIKTWDHSTGEQTAEANIDGIKGQIDVTASGDINVSSKKAIRATAEENIIITSAKNIRIWADARLQIRAEEAIRISSGERITMVAPEIHFNPEDDPDHDVSFIKEDESQLYLGDEGEEVLKLQEMLNELGYGVPLTGVFCQDTLDAVNAFKDEYLPGGNKSRWRGLVGPATLEALQNALIEREIQNRSELSLDSAGEDVTRLIEILTELGFTDDDGNPLDPEIDVFDEKVLQALNKFMDMYMTDGQRGIVDANVWRELLRRQREQQQQQAPRVTITFDANGGTLNSPESITIPSGTSITETINDPHRSNHTFKGWRVTAPASVQGFAAASGSAVAHANIIGDFFRWLGGIIFNTNLSLAAEWEAKGELKGPLTIIIPAVDNMGLTIGKRGMNIVLRATPYAVLRWNLRDITNSQNAAFAAGGPINEATSDMPQTSFVIPRDVLSAGRRYELNIRAEDKTSGVVASSYRLFTVTRFDDRDIEVDITYPANDNYTWTRVPEGLTVTVDAASGVERHWALRNLTVKQLLFQEQEFTGPSFNIDQSHLVAGHRYSLAVRARINEIDPGVWSGRDVGVQGGKKMFIDAGHNDSGWNTGATGNGMREQDITYEVSKYLGYILESQGFEVMLSRPTRETNLGHDNSSSINARWQMANAFGADYFISIHVNSVDNETANGAETFVYREEPNLDRRNRSEKFAKSVNDIYVIEMGLHNRGVRPDTESSSRSLGVLRSTNMPAILVELGFLSSLLSFPDVDILQNKRPEMAEALAKGIIAYFSKQ